MRLSPWGPSTIRYALCTALYVWALVGAFSAAGDARQLQPLTAGVYSAAQAARGQQLYLKECVSCHGKMLEGTIGPAMVGNDFLANYSARPLAALVDKIQKTMPFNLPGSLSRPQSTDLAAFVLQSNKFPAGQADVTDAQLAQIAFPTARAAAAPVASAAAGSLPPPEGSLAEFMRSIAFPNANIIFNLQIKDPTGEKPAPSPVPFDYVKWGSTIYPGWLAIDQAAIALTETAPLLLTPRKCQNGRNAPVDRADWKGYVADLVTVGKLAHATSKARNFDAFVDVSEKLNEACAACHRVYRDKGGTEGSGAARCE